MLSRRLTFLLAAGLLALPAFAQEMQWEDYDPQSTLVVPENPRTSAKYPFVDAHAHQWRIGEASAEEVAELVAAMDAMNMAIMVNLSGGSGDALKQKVENTEQHAPGRFVHYANIDFEQIDDPDFGTKAAAQLEADVRNGAKGLKIFKNLGMSVFYADGSRVPTDDPRLEPIWDKAGELGIPVLIHTGDPAPFWDDHDRYNERWYELKERPNRKRPPEPSWETIMGEHWNLIRKHPNTTFISAHLSWLGNDLGRLGMLLDSLPNMYTELGAVLAELGRQPRQAKQFLTQHQDRVLMGKDSWAPDEYHVYFRTLETADEFFDYYRQRHAWWNIYGLDLPDEVLRKIYYKNAARIIPGLDTSLLPDDYNVTYVPAPDPRPSPMALARTTLSDGTYVKVHYSSPRKRGRVIFGNLVPYGEIWRTAANEATEITLTGDVRLGDEILPAGTYSLFTIPDEDTWTVIFNKGLGQSGTAQYSMAEDALRIDVPAQTTDRTYEAFTIDFEQTGGGTDLVLMWDRTRVAVPLRVTG